MAVINVGFMLKVQCPIANKLPLVINQCACYQS